MQAPDRKRTRVRVLHEKDKAAHRDALMERLDRLPRRKPHARPPVRHVVMKGPQVTDHAVVKYLERCLGIDVDSLRADMLADGRAQLIEVLGSGKFPLGNGARLVVQSGVVVTVYGKEDDRDLDQRA